MEGEETFDSAVCRLFHSTCGNGYLSRREVVQAAVETFPGCGMAVGRFFDSFFDAKRLGTCQLYDLASGLCRALDAKLEGVEEAGGSWKKLVWLWDEAMDRPALARGMSEEQKSKGEQKDRLVLLLSLQWMRELGEGTPEVETFDNQVGGHKGDAEMKAAGTTIMKPLNMQEVRAKKLFVGFRWLISYQWLFYENLDLMRRKGLVPDGLFARFHGRTSLPAADGGWSDWLVLENLCQVMKHPSILDLKIGSSSLGATKAGAVKKVKQAVVKVRLALSLFFKIISHHWQAMTTSSTLGFRVAGMKVYHPSKAAHDTKPKKYGMSLTKANVHTAFQEFLSPDGAWQESLAKQLLAELQRIRTFFAAQQLFSFNSSSLLCLYDNGELIVRLIDFAHCYPLPGETNEHGFVSCAPVNPAPVPQIAGSTQHALSELLFFLLCRLCLTRAIFRRRQSLRRILLIGLPLGSQAVGQYAPGAFHIQVAGQAGGRRGPRHRRGHAAPGR